MNMHRRSFIKLFVGAVAAAAIQLEMTKSLIEEKLDIWRGDGPKEAIKEQGFLATWAREAQKEGWDVKITEQIGFSDMLEPKIQQRGFQW